MNMESFAKKIQPERASSRIKKIKIRLVVSDCTGIIKATDIMLQGGSTATRWIGHPSEIKWSFDNE